MRKEIEVLVELYTDLAEARSTLAEFSHIGLKRTVDRYYYDPNRPQLQLNENNKLLECCRIREKGDKCYFTYKTDVYDHHTWLYSNENEVECSNATELMAILEKLQLKLLVQIDSKKYIFRSSNYEIVLEEVAGLGNFLEIEYTAEEAFDIEDVKNGIREFIRKLGLKVGEELNSGKPELLLLKKIALSTK